MPTLFPLSVITARTMAWMRPVGSGRRGVFAVLAAALLVSAAPVDAAFTVEGRRILRDGLPFQVRGVCYQPDRNSVVVGKYVYIGGGRII